MALDTASSDSISVLVGHFLDAAQAVVANADPDTLAERPAELSYELDQVVSNFLDEHQLSPDHHEAIQQDVLNSIAHQLSADEHASADAGGLFDLDGNAGHADVLTLLDHHTVHDLAADLSVHSPDSHHNA